MKNGDRQILEILRLFCLAAVLCTYGASSTRGQNKSDLPKDGNGLIEACSGVIDLVDSPTSITSLQGTAFTDKVGQLSWCLGYLQATHDGLITGELNLAIIAMTGVTLAGPDKAKTSAFDALRVACIPENVSPLQMARVLVKWLRDHPERLGRAETLHQG